MPSPGRQAIVDPTDLEADIKDEPSVELDRETGVAAFLDTVGPAEVAPLRRAYEGTVSGNAP